jgi:signal transduction histidine kinase
MKTTFLEPGLLQVFRLFTGLRLGLMVLGAASHLVFRDLPGHFDYTYAWFSFAEVALLLVYLSWSTLQRWLGRAYLPIGLGIATIGPIIGQNLLLRERIDFGAGTSLVGAWQLLPLLFIPLVFTSWQYNFRSVLLFCLTTALLDWGLTMSVVGTTDMRLFLLAGALFIRTISFIVVGYMVVRLMTTQREQRQALAEANTQLAHYAATLEQLATSRERNRLARELHDTLAHSLSGIAVQLEAVKTLWENSPEDARAMLEQSLATTRSGLTETRRALQALRASPLEDLGLALAVRSLAESVAARNGLALDLEAPERLENLSPDLEQGIYRIVQEALENIARHANARNVKVQVSQTDGRFSLTISDDGQGFQMESVDMIKQFGLQGMHERTEMLGGDLEVESQPGHGTTIRLAWGGRT